MLSNKPIKIQSKYMKLEQNTGVHDGAIVNLFCGWLWLVENGETAFETNRLIMVMQNRTILKLVLSSILRLSIVYKSSL